MVTQVRTEQIKDASLSDKDIAIRGLRQWLKNKNQTAYVNVGFDAAPTLTSSTAVATGDQAARPYLLFDTAASSGSACGVDSAANTIVARSFEPTFTVPIRTGPSITNARFWIGFSSASLDAVGAPTTQSVAAFRYSDDIDGTAFWVCVTCNAASGVTANVSSVAVATATEYVMRIQMDTAAGTVSFYINNQLLFVHSTNLPPSTNNMGIRAKLITLDASSKQVRVGTVTLLHN